MRRARSWLVAAAVCGGAIAGGVAAASSGAGSPHVSSPPVAVFRRALEAKLRPNYFLHWVVCVRSGARFEGVPVVRCNVDFGDPHIQAYCAVFRGGELVVSEDDPAIPCARDDAGWTAPIQTHS